QEVPHSCRVAGNVRIGPAWGHEDHDQRERSQPYSETSNAFHARNLRSPSRAKRGQRQNSSYRTLKRPSIYDETWTCQPESSGDYTFLHRSHALHAPSRVWMASPSKSLFCNNLNIGRHFDATKLPQGQGTRSNVAM